MKKTIITLFSLCGVASAASYTWNGGDTIDSSKWADKDNWILAEGTTWEDNTNGPGTTDSDMWSAIIIAGADGRVGDKNESVDPIIEGWNFNLTLKNGADLTIGQIKKFQGETDQNNTPNDESDDIRIHCIINIDSTSSLTIDEFWGGNDGNSIFLNNAGSFTLNYSCRVQGGDGFVMNLYDSGHVTFLDQNHATANTAKVASITAQLTGVSEGVLERQLITLDSRDGKLVSFDDTVTTYSFTDAEGNIMNKVDSLAALTSAVAPSYYITKDASGIKVSYVLVPEPTTATLSLLALAGLAARRRRK